jgi:YD repeat-containing protein
MPRALTSRTLAVVTALFTSVLADNAGRQQKPPAQPGPAPAKGPCRTYDTSVTSVTAGGPMQATVEWTGSFDPWSLRFVQNINFSSNQGSRFSYVQVSTFPSAEDFIAEVVRLKPPAPLSTNPNGPVLGIVPPLTRSLSTVGNGAIALSKTNSFDSNGRVTGFSARSSGGTITMRYSAWDALGRPTAGTMQSPAGASTQTIAYDDNARAMTEVLNTRGITSTMTYTYDESGNLRSTASTVTRGQGSTTTVTPRSSATVCLGDLRPVAPPPARPTGPNPAGTFTATIGGQGWSAALGLHASNTGAVVSVGGGDKRFIVSLGMSARRGPGQYQAGALADEDFTRLTSDQFKDLIDRNSVVATVFDSVTKQSWQASPTIGTGTVTLTSVSGAAAGTFSLTLEPVPGTRASGSINFSGAFNIKY